MYLGVLVIALIVGSVRAQETITLTAPETFTTLSALQTERITVDFAAGTIAIHLLGNQGAAVSCQYGPTTNPTGAFLITGLNKANLSTAYAGNATTGSLKQRIFHRLIVLGEALAVCGRSLSGSVTGSVP